MLQDGSLISWVWFSLALVSFAVEAIRPRRFALWLGFAAVMVGVIASVARWPWPVQVLALVALAALLIPAWRRYEHKA
jgi:membrane protein implicated in regulation of membrane protease activity